MCFMKTFIYIPRSEETQSSKKEKRRNLTNTAALKKSEKNVELTRLANQVKMFYLSIMMRVQICLVAFSDICEYMRVGLLSMFNSSWCRGRFLLMCLTADVKGAKPKTHFWCAFHESVFPTEYCFCISSNCSNTPWLIHCFGNILMFQIFNS